MAMHEGAGGLNALNPCLSSFLIAFLEKSRFLTPSSWICSLGTERRRQMKAKKRKDYSQMSKADLDQIARKFDRSMVIDESAPLTPQMKAADRRARRCNRNWDANLLHRTT